MNIRVKEEEIPLLAQQLLHTLVNLRHFTKQWETEYGNKAKYNKQYWEQRADDLLKLLEMEKTAKPKEIVFRSETDVD